MTKLTVGGIPVDVVSDEEAERCDYLICMPASSPSLFDDDLFGRCVECGTRVRYRWHAPRKPKRLCHDCLPKVERRLCHDCLPKVERRVHVISETTRQET